MQKSPLWNHQQEHLKKMIQVVAGEIVFPPMANLSDPGTGKTRTQIEVLRAIFNSGQRVKRTLILGPDVVLPQWKKQILAYSQTPPDKIYLLQGPGAKRVKLFDKALTYSPKGFIALLNYEGLRIPALYDKLYAWQPEVAVADESHRIKDWSGKQAKLAVKMVEQFIEKKSGRVTRPETQYRYIMTGTPAPNTPMDLFMQYRFLLGGFPDGHGGLIKNFTEFRLTFFFDKNAGMPKHRYFPDWQLRSTSMEVFKRVLAATSVQAKKEECLDLPPEIHIEVCVDMGPEQRAAYEQMKAVYVAHVKNKTITAQLAIVQALRLRQILSGYAANTRDEAPYYFPENPRLKALLAMLEDKVLGGHKVVIWCNFEPEYRMLREALDKAGYKYVFLTGNESAAEKAANVERFTLGDSQIAVCNSRAVGLGIDLIQSDTVFRYSHSHSWGDYDQSNARTYRGGSEMHKSVTYYSFKVENTLDAVMLGCLQGKGDMAEALLSWALREP